MKHTGVAVIHLLMLLQQPVAEAQHRFAPVGPILRVPDGEPPSAPPIPAMMPPSTTTADNRGGPAPQIPRTNFAPVPSPAFLENSFFDNEEQRTAIPIPAPFPSVPPDASSSTGGDSMLEPPFGPEGTIKTSAPSINPTVPPTSVPVSLPTIAPIAAPVLTNGPTTHEPSGMPTSAPSNTQSERPSVQQEILPANLVWNEEFDQEKLDPFLWNVREGKHHSTDIAVYEKGQVQVDFDTLDITVLRRGVPVSGGGGVQIMYPTGLVDTAKRFWFQYGTATFRVWMPDSDQGLLPRLSLVGQDSEIVVALLGTGDQPNKHVVSSLHYREGRETIVKSGALNFEVDLTDNFHEYTVEWTPTTISTRVDHRTIFTHDITSLEAFQKSAYLMIDLGVASVEDPDMISAQTPGTMMIDYIRIFDLEGFTELLMEGGVEAPTTLSPTIAPSLAPSMRPSVTPSMEPTTAPSGAPSMISYANMGTQQAPAKVILETSDVGLDYAVAEVPDSSSSNKGMGKRGRRRATAATMPQEQGRRQRTRRVDAV